mmetsp:Transcript_5299/g.15412  ORF Transcript_5299/g.15412 Transcript_5299/m.15412 type:complete len:215 (-) Transcript_5299:191-835(-)
MFPFNAADCCKPLVAAEPHGELDKLAVDTGLILRFATVLSVFVGASDPPRAEIAQAPLFGRGKLLACGWLGTWVGCFFFFFRPTSKVGVVDAGKVCSDGKEDSKLASDLSGTARDDGKEALDVDVDSAADNVPDGESRYRRDPSRTAFNIAKAAPTRCGHFPCMLSSQGFFWLCVTTNSSPSTVISQPLSHMMSLVVSFSDLIAERTDSSVRKD